MRRFPAVLALVAVVLGSGDAMSAPLWDRLLAGKGTARDHLRLAEGYAARGRCGAAVFHFRMYLGKGASPFLRKQVKERIDACLKRSGWGPFPRPKATQQMLILREGRSETVAVPGGAVHLGSTPAERDVVRALCEARLGRSAARRCSTLRFPFENQQRRVRVHAFRLQRTEVSRRAYQACVQAKACRQVPARFRAPGKGNLPMVGVTWAEARSYCRWRGGDLPTERQWVAAARGDTMPPRLWPWGRHAVRGCARILAPKVASIGPVGGQPCDASAFGVLGLAGNVREWVRRSSAKAGATTRIARGGSFRQAEWWSRAATRWRIAAGSRVDDVGLRCVGVRESGRSAKGR